MHIGEEVGRLASQKICHVSQRFCEAWPSNQIQLKSCCWMEKLSSTMDCSRLCTAAAGHLEIVVSGTGISYWQSCACIMDNSSPPSDDVVCTDAPQKSCVVYTVLCTNESRPSRGQREWNLPLTFFHRTVWSLWTRLSSFLFLILHPLWGQYPRLVVVRVEATVCFFNFVKWNQSSSKRNESNLVTGQTVK
jgi:hypothetical protein